MGLLEPEIWSGKSGGLIEGNRDKSGTKIGQSRTSDARIGQACNGSSASNKWCWNTTVRLMTQGAYAFFFSKWNLSLFNIWYDRKQVYITPVVSFLSCYNIWFYQQLAFGPNFSQPRALMCKSGHLKLKSRSESRHLESESRGIRIQLKEAFNPDSTSNPDSHGWGRE